MRECINCKKSRGLGADVWCGEGHTEYESYMRETDCPYWEENEMVVILNDVFEWRKRGI